MNSLIHSTKGVSLPLAIGLIVLLMAGTVAINQLVTTTLRSVQQIESSNRAYLVAEAGMEDALYELSPHFAGYQTPTLTSEHVRQTHFAENDIIWRNQWSIRSRDNNENCEHDRCGVLRGRKLVIPLFQDVSELSAEDAVTALAQKHSLLNTASPQINTLSVSDFNIRFRVPEAIVMANDDSDTAFIPGLVIDNDGDAWITPESNGINEDGKNDNGVCPGESGESRDADCDGREDEDSAADPVLHWKISDGAGKQLTPKSGCFTANEAPGSTICEQDFIRDGDSVQFTLLHSALGVREDGQLESIGSFLANYDAFDAKQLQMEVLIVAPLEQVDFGNQKKIPIPFLVYEIDATTSTDAAIPNSYFGIQSDGYYRDFKQSLNTLVTPRVTVPLFDFTILQQN